MANWKKYMKNVKDVINAELEGRVRQYAWRKNSSQVSSAGLWYDLSMSPGNPIPKYWFDASPGIAKAVYQSTDGGLFHGANVSPSEKYLRSITAYTTSGTPLPMTMALCDYLLYYPSIDEGTTDFQTLNNTISLPRYTDGEGVQIVPITVGTRTSTVNFTVNYTNSKGISNRTSVPITLNTGVVGTVAGSALVGQNSSNPFIGLQSGDSGVRSIDGVKMASPTDGLFSLVLVKPIARTLIFELSAPVEKDFLMTQSDLPRIYDDAYLNFLVLPNGALSGMGVIGDIKIIWS